MQVLWPITHSSNYGLELFVPQASNQFIIYLLLFNYYFILFINLYLLLFHTFISLFYSNYLYFFILYYYILNIFVLIFYFIIFIYSFHFSFFIVTYRSCLLSQCCVIYLIGTLPILKLRWIGYYKRHNSNATYSKLIDRANWVYLLIFFW